MRFALVVACLFVAANAARVENEGFQFAESLVARVESARLAAADDESDLREFLADILQSADDLIKYAEKKVSERLTKKDLPDREKALLQLAEVALKDDQKLVEDLIKDLKDATKDKKAIIKDVCKNAETALKHLQTNLEGLSKNNAFKPVEQMVIAALARGAAYLEKVVEEYEKNL